MRFLPDVERVNAETRVDQRASYEAPAIIYEGVISTRAGTGDPLGDGSGSDDSVDPADLFGN